MGIAQEGFEEKISSLGNQIENSKGAKKLVLMDSLSRLISSDRNGYHFDSITKATIALAYELDSLEIALSRTDDLIFYYANRTGMPEMGVTVFEDFEGRNLEPTNYKMLAKLYTNAGDAYFFSGAMKESEPVYRQAELYAIKANDSIRYAMAKTYKAAYYMNIGDYAKASNDLKETATIFTKKRDTPNILMARNSLANIYSMIGFSTEAKSERDEVIRLAELTKNYNSLIPNIYNATLDAKKSGDLELQIAYLKKAEKIIAGIENPPVVAQVIEYALLGAYAQSDSLDKAKSLYDKIQKEYTGTTTVFLENEYRNSLVEYYLAINDHAKAKKEAEKLMQLSLRANYSEGIYQTYKQLATIAEAEGDFKNALAYSEKYHTFIDSINSVQKARGLSYYQTLYEMEKREFKIQDQASEISLLDAKNRIQTQWIIFGGLGLLALFTIIYLIRSKRFAQSRQELQEQFSQDLINEQEKERTRLARELHDSVGQKLMLLSRQTKNSGDSNMKGLADDTLKEIRDISRGLHPSNLERLGITESINALVYDINANTSLFFTEEIDNIDNVLSKEDELHLYRIVQEILSNIVKHAEAKAVKMKVNKEEKSITVLVSDNGKGFDFEEKYKNLSLGLKTLYERAKIIGAQLNVNTKFNNGTVMELTVPI